MDFLNKNVIKSIFNCLCSIVVIFMIGYWAYKYEIDDRDVGVVDYISLQASPNVNFPVLSVCFVNPIVEHKLNYTTNDSINVETYIQYLKGEVWSKELERVDYEYVTLDLNDYLEFVLEEWTNSSTMRESFLSLHHRNMFSGFFRELFIKCFTIDIDLENHRYIKNINLHYNRTRLLKDWSDIAEVSQTINGSKWEYDKKVHYPGQFLLGDDPLVSNPYNDTEPFLSFDAFITDVEILERRNSRNKKCSKSEKTYDDFILQAHLAKHGCRPPYLVMSNEYPLCRSAEKIKASKFLYSTAKHMSYPKECVRMPKVKFEGPEHKLDDWENDWQVFIGYPEEIKYITQSKEVDIHTLIGNCGGYLGLFLGNSYRNTAYQNFSLLRSVVINYIITQ